MQRFETYHLVLTSGLIYIICIKIFAILGLQAQLPPAHADTPAAPPCLATGAQWDVLLRAAGAAAGIGGGHVQAGGAGAGHAQAEGGSGGAEALHTMMVLLWRGAGQNGGAEEQGQGAAGGMWDEACSLLHPAAGLALRHAARLTHEYLAGSCEEVAHVCKHPHDCVLRRLVGDAGHLA